MTKPVTIPNTFATATTAIPLSNLDADFSTVATAMNDANTYSNYAADTGSANAYVVTFSGVSTLYSAGLRIQFKAGNANTGASTINVNAQGAKNITYQDGNALASGTIAVNSIVDVMYDGTQFLLMNDPAGATGGDVTGPASATDNAIVRFDGTTGKLVQNSVVTIADSTGDISGVGQLNATTVDTTNLEVTNIKAKDGTASATIADSTGVMTIATLVGTNDATISGLTVGKGAGAVSTNTAVGASALAANTTGARNNAFGWRSLYSNTTGADNTALGYAALYTNSTGSSNTAVGRDSLPLNTTGSSNVAVGLEALRSNTTASNNTAVGYQAGYSNTTGYSNAILGQGAGYSTTTGYENTAVGQGAAYGNTTGYGNVAIGLTALNTASTANLNTALGYRAGYSVTTGGLNTFVGQFSGYSMTTGSKNTILGAYNGNQGGLDIRTASNYIVLSDGDGNPLVSTYKNGTVALDGAVPNNGTGITFPATQNASSNANTLDDYEEGTWTAVMPTESGSDYTITSQTCRYTKIGNTVTVNATITYSAVGNGTISRVTLPFTPLQSPMAIVFAATITGTSGGNYITELSLIPYTGNELLLRVSNINTNYWSASNSWSSSGTFSFCGTFITST